MYPVLNWLMLAIHQSACMLSFCVIFGLQQVIIIACISSNTLVGMAVSIRMDAAILGYVLHGGIHL